MTMGAVLLESICENTELQNVKTQNYKSGF